MRKIKTKHDERKRQKRNQMIIGMVLIFVMFFSVLGYAFRGESEDNTQKIVYNGFEFTEQNGLWFLDIENFNFVFKNNPQQVEKIEGELKGLNNYYGKPLYIYSEDDEAELEIYRNLFYQNQVVQRMQPACLNQSEDILDNETSEECGEDLPTKNCENNFIIIEENNESGIIQKENCVFILGKQENLTKITDEFLFKILGVEDVK